VPDEPDLRTSVFQIHRAMAVRGGNPG
jgi:hypothetical protein